MKIRMILTAVIAAALLAGCQSYGKQYQAYMQMCSIPDNQKIIRVPGASGGETVINLGCTLQPPVDASAKWVNLGATVGTALIQEGGATYRSVKSTDANRDILTTFGENMGHSVGGDATIGDGNSGNQNVDQTAPPPDPIIIEPSGDGE